MLKNKSTRQNRKSFEGYLLRIERDDRHAEEIADGIEELVFVHLAGIENLPDPGAAIEILGQLGGFFESGNTSRDQEIDYRFADRRIHWGITGADTLSVTAVKSSNKARILTVTASYV